MKIEIQTGIQIRKKQESPSLIRNIKDPKFLLMYAPQCHDPAYGVVKPEISLGNLYLAAVLEENGFEVDILDCCVGNERYSMEESFNHVTPLPNGLSRIGLSLETIIKDIKDYDVIGISSIFTPQTRMVEELVRSVSSAYPEKLILMGGINARSQMQKFFDAGVHLICISEAERTILRIGTILRQGSRDFSSVPGVAFLENGKIQVNAMTEVEDNLDNLPIPARHKLPLQRIAEIARPHGGGFKSGQVERSLLYVSAMTSRGCPYKCDFCHISGEQKDSLAGYLGKFRYQSEERVEREMATIKEIGAKFVYIEDDSMLAKKKRALNIFRMLMKFGFKLGGVNGVNLSHLHKNEGGKIVVDDEMVETMAEAGFDRLLFPVESGSQRIIDKWVSGKISHDIYDISLLIKKANSVGIMVSSCYLIGYPDETYEELAQTILTAKKHMDAGSEYVNFSMVTPFPGTTLYDYVVQNNLLLPGIEIADLNWLYPSMKTIIDPYYLEFISRKAWEFINKPERVEVLRSLAPKTD